MSSVLTVGNRLKGILASVTAGNVYFHPRFDPGRDREAVHEELRRVIGQEVVYNAALRVRCSNSKRYALLRNTLLKLTPDPASRPPHILVHRKLLPAVFDGSGIRDARHLPIFRCDPQIRQQAGGQAGVIRSSCGSVHERRRRTTRSSAQLEPARDKSHRQRLQICRL